MSSMAKNASADTGGFWSGLLRVGLYKPNQGRVVRQVTFVGAVILALLSCYQIAGMEIWEWLLAAIGGEAFGKVHFGLFWFRWARSQFGCAFVRSIIRSLQIF